MRKSRNASLFIFSTFTQAQEFTQQTKLFNDRLRKGFYVVLARDKKRKFELIPIALLRTSPSVLKHEVCLYRRALNDRVCARGGSASS